MSYNGIGLSTARGSGTNGYVQRNLGNKDTLGQYERRKQLQAEKERQYLKSSKLSKRKTDQDIIDHDLKREIELKCSLLRDELEEDDDLEDDVIDVKVQELRERLYDENERAKRALERDQRLKAKPYQSVSDKRERSPVRDDKSETEAQSFMDSFKTKEMDY